MLPWSDAPRIKRRSPESNSDWGFKVEGISDCMYLRSASALEKHNPAEESSYKRSVQIWPQERMWTETDRTPQVFCQSVIWGQYMSRARYMSFLSPLKHVNVNVLIRLTHSAQNRKTFQFNVRTSWKSQYISDLHGKWKTHLLHTTLSKQVSAACAQRHSKRKKQKLQNLPRLILTWQNMKESDLWITGALTKSWLMEPLLAPCYVKGTDTSRTLTYARIQHVLN